MSDSERPEKAAFQELETLVRHLAGELASFRRRALTAEARVRTLEGRSEADPAGGSAIDRVEELEQRNALLDTRVEQARARAEQMLERVRFLRQQAKAGGSR